MEKIMKTKKHTNVLHATCSPMQRMYRICICGCQAIYIQVRPLRKEKFNGRIHGLLPALLPGYMCCSLMILPVLNSVQSRQVQRHTH